jgi:hypothetical protein
MNVASPAGIAATWSATNAEAAQQAVALSVLKSQAEAGQAVVAMLAEAVASERSSPAAPPGQGQAVDKRV